MLRILEDRTGANDRDFSLRGKLLQPAGQRGDDLFLAGAHGRQIDGWFGKSNAPFGKLFGFGLGLRHVQQCLRRDAAAQQADAA